jgi:Antitoxin Phd_YefM, type II toxin-antitoxin system
MAGKGRGRGAASPPVVHRLPLTQARVNLGAVIKRARLHKEYFVLEKDGIPVAVLMDIDAFEDHLELQDPKVRAVIAEGRREYLAGKSRPARDLLRALQARPRGKPPRRRTA